MKKHLTGIIVSMAVVAVLVLYSVAFTLRWKEQALVVTLGKISRVEVEPGLKWKWPYPIQKVVTFDGRIKTYEPKATQIQTRDKQTIIAQAYVNWRIVDVRQFYTTFLKDSSFTEADVIAHAESILGGWVSEAHNVFAEYRLGELVTLNPEQFRLLEVETGKDGSAGGMLARVREKAAGSGIEIVDMGISRLGVPDSVSSAVFARMKEERNAETNRLLAEGKAEAESIRGKAEAAKTRIMADAEAKARSIKGQGDAEAAQHYAKFVDEPELANFLRRLDTLRTTLNDRTTIVIDSDSPAYNLLSSGPEYGPLATK